ncbi:FAD-binding oxidoreductase [Mycobacterium sp. CSUR Q5927]|nr:FAD-binding oxidoreductase [Mycobacterium sp. CSUR Q5927]
MTAIDVGVVGGGIVGLSTASALSELGATVRVYERGVPGDGQSGGESRIFRHAHDDARLVALARASRAIWAEWAERAGAELVSPDGAVAIGPAVSKRLATLDEVGGVPVRRIDGAELRALLPPLADYDGPAMLDEAGGSIRTRAAVGALTGWLGERLVADEVLAVRPTRSGTAEVLTGGARTEHSAVVVCAGRGTAGLARGVGMALPVRLSAHVRLTFGVTAPAQQLACLQDSSGAFGETGTYAAALPGNRFYAVGLAESVGVDPDGGFPDPGELTALADRAVAYVRRALPGLDPAPVGYRHCWVTRVPWSDDGFAAWQRDGLVFVAGHNLFKQAPAIGRAVARLALGEQPEVDLRPECRLGAAS